MKKAYHLILTIITIALLVLVTFNQINSATGWVDLGNYQTAIDYAWKYGPVAIMCLFAFGNLFGKIASKVMFILITILLIIFTITMFAPGVVTAIFG